MGYLRQKHKLANVSLSTGETPKVRKHWKREKSRMRRQIDDILIHEMKEKK